MYVNIVVSEKRTTLCLLCQLSTVGYRLPRSSRVTGNQGSIPQKKFEKLFAVIFYKIFIKSIRIYQSNLLFRIARLHFSTYTMFVSDPLNVVVSRQLAFYIIQGLFDFTLLNIGLLIKINNLLIVYTKRVNRELNALFPRRILYLNLVIE